MSLQRHPDRTVQDFPTMVARAHTGKQNDWREVNQFVRSPNDLFRFLVGSIATVVVAIFIAIPNIDGLAPREAQQQLFRWFGITLTRLIHGSLELSAFIVAVAILLMPIINRNLRLLFYQLVAAVTAIGATYFLRVSLSGSRSLYSVSSSAKDAGITWSFWSASPGNALLAALFIVLAPFVSSRWRRAGIYAYASVVFARLVVPVEPLSALVSSVPLGASVGWGVLTVLGRPDYRPSILAVQAGLHRVGIPASFVYRAPVSHGRSNNYEATTDDGQKLFVKVFGKAQRSADLLYRFYRFLRLKDVGDTRPFSSLRRSVEHEGLMSLYTRDTGVHAAKLRGIANLNADTMFLVYDTISGASLNQRGADAITDDVLLAYWREVKIMQSNRIAHRDLCLSNILTDSSAQPWIVDFGFAECGVNDDLLATDVAQSLASFTTIVDAQRAVSTAIAILGTDTVARSLPRIQLPAMSSETRAVFARDKTLLKTLQDEVMRQCNVANVDYIDLERVDRQTVFGAAALVGILYFLVPQLTDLHGIMQIVRHGDWKFIPLVLLATAGSYVGATIALAGSTTRRLPLIPLTVSQIAASFVNKIAPAGLGGIAFNIRFLQTQGESRADGIASMGLNTIGYIIGQLFLFVLFLMWAGQAGVESFSFPAWQSSLIGAAIAFSFLGTAIAVPYSRNLLREKLGPIFVHAADGVAELFHRPLKMAELLSGSVLTSFAYLLAMYFSVVTFGGTTSIATVGVIFLLADLIGRVAPTPGGLGGVEAALISGFAAAGLDESVAVPAVLLYRLCTFWIPVLPGWLSFAWLQKRGYV